MKCLKLCLLIGFCVGSSLQGNAVENLASGLSSVANHKITINYSHLRNKDFEIIGKGIEQILQRNKVLEHFSWGSLLTGFVPKETIVYLLKKGLSPNGKALLSREIVGTPLHLALRLNNKDIVNVLLRYGADVDEKDSNGRESLDYAMDTKDNYLISLIKAFSDYTIARKDKKIDQFLNNPENVEYLQEFFELAVNEGHREVIDVLIEKDPKQFTYLKALEIAARNNRNRRGLVPTLLAKFVTEKNEMMHLLGLSHLESPRAIIKQLADMYAKIKKDNLKEVGNGFVKYARLTGLQMPGIAVDPFAEVISFV